MNKLIAALGILLSLSLSVSASELPTLFEDQKTTVETLFCPYDAALAEQKTLDMLQRAKKSILMSCYALTDSQIVDALIKAHESGLDVRILMDKTQSCGSHQALVVKRLQQAQIPLTIGTSPAHGQLLHSKFVVVDHEYTEDGSWNFTGTTAGSQSNTLNFSTDTERAQEFERFWTQMSADMIKHNADKISRRKHKKNKRSYQSESVKVGA